MEIGNRKSTKNAKLSYAVASFPDEVKLCVSGIPGAGYGVCAKQHIPVGTWIGPYEGKRLSINDVTSDKDTSYMWEVCLQAPCLSLIITLYFEFSKCYIPDHRHVSRIT